MHFKHYLNDLETVFTHNPTRVQLDEIGVPETSEKKYLDRVATQDKGSEIITYLFDLNAYFSLIGNEKEVQRIESELQKNGAFANGFNE